MRSENRIMRNDRGVALLIVLLVTALLTALIFEFAYGTRISLRAAVNFRDSQRAYFLARSGVNFAGALLSDNLKNNKPRDNLEQRDWQLVPVMTGSDTELRVRWEDEGGKINISSVFTGNDASKRLSRLFENPGISISQDLLEKVEEKRNFRLITELHQVLSDEEFGKVKDFVTVSPVSRININTASTEVLQSLSPTITASMAGMIIEKRSREPFVHPRDINDFPGMNAITAGMLDVTSNVFKVSSFATVGGYTKQVEAAITRSTSGFSIIYWRAL